MPTTDLRDQSAAAARTLRELYRQCPRMREQSTPVGGATGAIAGCYSDQTAAQWFVEIASGRADEERI